MSRGAKEKWKRKPSTSPGQRGVGVQGSRAKPVASRWATAGGSGPPLHAVPQRNDITFLVANEENV